MLKPIQVPCCECGALRTVKASGFQMIQKAREARCGQCRVRAAKRRGVLVPSYGGGAIKSRLPLPPYPTEFRPGTAEKIAVMQARLEQGYHLHHPDDEQAAGYSCDVAREVFRETRGAA